MASQSELRLVTHFGLGTASMIEAKLIPSTVWTSGTAHGIAAPREGWIRSGVHGFRIRCVGSDGCWVRRRCGSRTGLPGVMPAMPVSTVHRIYQPWRGFSWDLDGRCGLLGMVKSIRLVRSRVHDLVRVNDLVGESNRFLGEDRIRSFLGGLCKGFCLELEVGGEVRGPTRGTIFACLARLGIAPFANLAFASRQKRCISTPSSISLIGHGTLCLPAFRASEKIVDGQDGFACDACDAC